MQIMAPQLSKSQKIQLHDRKCKTLTLLRSVAIDMTSTIPPIAILSLPAPDDNVEVVDVKLSSHLYIVHVGNSIATATGSVYGESECNPAELRAITAMRPHEQENYEAWKERSPLALRCIDWDLDQGRTPTSQRPLKKATRCAAALDRLTVRIGLSRGSRL